VTIKVSSLLAVIAIWAAMITAVINEPDAAWSLVFAALATAAIGIGFWRRLGLSRLVAITGIWAGTVLVVGSGEAAWPSVLAFFATAVIAHAPGGRAIFLLDLAAAFVWLIAAFVVVDQHDGSYVLVFAALTVWSLVGGHPERASGAVTILWWALAASIILVADGFYRLSVLAWILSASSFDRATWRLPRKVEWDIFDHDDSRLELY